MPVPLRKHPDGEVRVRGSDDAGVTLLEVVVGMVIMSFVMLVFTAGLLSVVRAAGHSETVAMNRSQLNVAFDRLDRQIRYASGISVPGTAGGDSYVEFQTDGPGGALCTQLRLNATAHRLEQRTWSRGATPGAAWTILASGLSAAEPFRRLSAGSGSAVQRLRLLLTADLPPGSTGQAPQTDITFSALNTSSLTSSDQICGEGRPT